MVMVVIHLYIYRYILNLNWKCVEYDWDNEHKLNLEGQNKLLKEDDRNNKHTVSIAEAIHVPYRPQQISKRFNSQKSTWKDTKVKLFLHYVNTNSYPKLDVNILQRKVQKTKFK